MNLRSPRCVRIISFDMNFSFESKKKWEGDKFQCFVVGRVGLEIRIGYLNVGALLLTKFRKCLLHLNLMKWKGIRMKFKCRDPAVRLDLVKIPDYCPQTLEWCGTLYIG